jgi:hypothetical protein
VTSGQGRFVLQEGALAGLPQARQHHDWQLPQRPLQAGGEFPGQVACRNSTHCTDNMTLSEERVRRRLAGRGCTTRCARKRWTVATWTSSPEGR